MPVAPTPSEIFHRAADEGERRLDQSMLELVATGFIAGFTIVFAIAALGVVHGAVEPLLGPAARVAGALAFATGFVFLIVGRAELFTENFFDPAATAFERRERGLVWRLLRLWTVTLALNLAGGALMVLVTSVHGVLPEEAWTALRTVAREVAARGARAGFLSAIVGGALVALLSFMLQAADGVRSRITVAYFAGFLLAVGPFDHVVVTALHVLFGILLGEPIGYGTLAAIMGVSAAGNVVGGIGLVTLSHAAQAKGARESGGG